MFASKKAKRSHIKSANHHQSNLTPTQQHSLRQWAFLCHEVWILFTLSLSLPPRAVSRQIDAALGRDDQIPVLFVRLDLPDPHHGLLGELVPPRRIVSRIDTSISDPPLVGQHGGVLHALPGLQLSLVVGSGAMDPVELDGKGMLVLEMARKLKLGE